MMRSKPKRTDKKEKQQLLDGETNDENIASTYLPADVSTVVVRGPSPTAPEVGWENITTTEEASASTSQGTTTASSTALNFQTLPNSTLTPNLPEGVIVEVNGNIADHPFPQPPSSTSGKTGMFLMKASGVGYAYYRAANTRLNPGFITYLQDGSEQYVLAKPGLYYFPGPTRKLYKPQALGNEHIQLGNIKIVTVPPGKVGFCEFNSNIYLLEPAKTYVLNSPIIQYLGSESLNQSSIVKKSITIARIQYGEFACVKDAIGNIVVLKDIGRYLLRAPEALLTVHNVNDVSVEHEGYHRRRIQAGEMTFYQDEQGNTQYYNTPGTYELRNPAYFDGEIHNINDNVIAHGSISLMRLKAGQLACVQNPDGDIEVLDTLGMHEIRAPSQLLHIYSVNEPRIEHGTYERVRLQGGKIIFYQDENGKTQYYDQAGTYELRRPAYFDRDIHDLNEAIIQFGSIVRVNLKREQISFKYDKNGNTILLDKPGIHYIERPEVFGGELFNVKDKHLKLGSYEIINVPPGQVAITYDGRNREKFSDNQALRILPAGRHIMDDALWSLQEFRSIQEKPIDILCQEIYSENRVSFDVQAFLCFKVVDPKRAFVDVQDIEGLLQRKAVSTIVNIFGAHRSDEVAKGIAKSTNHTNAAGSSKTDTPPSYAEASFAELVETSFLQHIQKFAADRGVELTQMNVEHLDFHDKDMKSTIESQAEKTVKIEADRQNVEQENQTKRLKAEGNAKAAEITAQGKARAIEIEAIGTAQARNAETDAEVKMIRDVSAAQKEAAENPLSVQLLLMEKHFEGQAAVFAALSENMQVIPSDIRLNTNTLPPQFAALLSNQPNTLFSLPSQSTISTDKLALSPPSDANATTASTSFQESPITK